VRSHGSDLENKGIRGKMRVEPWRVGSQLGSTPLMLDCCVLEHYCSAFYMLCLVVFVFFQPSRFIGCYMRFVIPGSGQYKSPTGNRQKAAFEIYDLISQWRFRHPRNCRLISNIQKIQ
jgi:hypothetical protein